MPTESPVKLIGTTGSQGWSSGKDDMNFASCSKMDEVDFELLFKDHRFHERRKDIIPNRCGSAPPSMEGSFAALASLTAKQHSRAAGSFAKKFNGNETHGLEELIHADPVFLASYLSNVNLNPRLPPLVSWENWNRAQHISLLGESHRVTASGNIIKDSFLSQGALLSTHNEEHDNDILIVHGSSGMADRIAGFQSGLSMPSPDDCNKSVFDAVQEDNPQPQVPSPVSGSDGSCSTNHGVTEVFVDSDDQVSLLVDSSFPLGDPSAIPTPSASSSERISVSHACSKEELSCNSSNASHNFLVTGMAGSNIDSTKAEMSSSKCMQHPWQNISQSQGSTSQSHGAQSLSTSQFHGVQHLRNALDQSFQSQLELPAVEVQPVLQMQTSGIVPPPYTLATAYMPSGNPIDHNLQASSLFASQSSVGGYPLNYPFVPPFITGYPPYGAIPMSLDNPTNLYLLGHGGSFVPSVDFPHLYNVHGQPGPAVQPSYTDLNYMPYFQHPYQDAYGFVRYNSVPSRGNIIRGHADNSNPVNGPSDVYLHDQMPPFLRTPGVNIPDPRKEGAINPTYYGNPPNINFPMRYPASPVANPLMPGSPLTVTTPVGRNESINLSASSSRNAGDCSGLQGQRGQGKVDDPRTCSFLEELKSGKVCKFEIYDISGNIFAFSTDQYGSRFIQQKLETCSIEEKASLFEEVVPHVSTLMTDVFGNYVIQKLFEHGNVEQRKELACQLVGRILHLSLQMYGCRVIQKALEVIELDQKTQLVEELEGHVIRCVRDQNGNHVIQKCIECVPTERIGFIITSLQGQAMTLSMHPYGCRVIQRVLEHCTDELQIQLIVEEILPSADVLAEDQYANYVVQHILEKGKAHERSQIIRKFSGRVVYLSHHKFASNVIEKCLEHGTAAEQEQLIEEIIGQTEGNDNLLTMMKDQYANYVIQKVLETCTAEKQEILINHIRGHLQALKKYTYGKHIVACMERLVCEDAEASTPK